MTSSTTTTSLSATLVVLLLLAVNHHNANNSALVTAFSPLQARRQRATFVALPHNHNHAKFTTSTTTTTTTTTTLWDSPPEMETVTDVQEAIDLMEALEEQNEEMCSNDQEDPDADCTVVRLRNDMSFRNDITKEDLLADIQELVEDALEHATLQQQMEELPIPAPQTRTQSQTSQAQTQSRAKLELASDISRRLKFLTDDPVVEPVTPQEAAISASLYMNPATEKIARHVKITWEPQVADILNRLASVSNPHRPFMVGIVGVPGSGKSTSAEILAALLGNDRAIIMPMDGFHIPLAELAEFPNAANAIYRRGAPDTFYAKALQQELCRIAHGDEPTVCLPGFDHAVGDPTPDQHVFERTKHQIVLCEGLYLLHDDDGWEDIKSIFDWTIYIDANIDVCIERLKERNKCIPGYTPEEIEIRCEEVDRVNAMISRNGAFKYASQIVKSGASN